MKRTHLAGLALAGILVAISCQKNDLTNEIPLNEPQDLELNYAMNGQVIADQYIVVLDENSITASLSPSKSYTYNVEEMKTFAIESKVFMISSFPSEDLGSNLFLGESVETYSIVLSSSLDKVATVPIDPTIVIGSM